MNEQELLTCCKDSAEQTAVSQLACKRVVRCTSKLTCTALHVALMQCLN